MTVHSILQSLPRYYLYDLSPNLSFPFTFFRSEIDSELLDDKSEVLGVLAADNQGLCVLSQGEIEKNLSQVVSSLAKIAAQLEPNNENVPTIVLESQSKQVKLILFIIIDYLSF